MNLKIREAQMEKAPYMLIVGDKEMASSNVSLRRRTGGDVGSETVIQVRDRIKADIEARS
jgi:threonyl-tRNA synthetase